MASLREMLSRVELQAGLKGDDGFCAHLPPTICWPNGKIENSQGSCRETCGRPKLQIVISYDDPARWLRTAVADILEAWRSHPEEATLCERITWGATDYEIDFAELNAAVKSRLEADRAGDWSE